jgi:hypothetical protein
MRYSNKVLDTVKGINIEFGKKKKEEEDGRSSRLKGRPCPPVVQA